MTAALVLYLVQGRDHRRGQRAAFNDDLKAAGDPDRIADLAGVRQRFDEARWRAGTWSGSW